MTVKINLPEESDFLYAERIEISCRVGTTAEERAFPQVVEVSFRLFLPLKKAGGSDSLSDTIDYAQIIADIKETVSARQYCLVEAIAEKIASRVLKEKPARAVEVQISKRAFAGVGPVGACIFRKK